MVYALITRQPHTEFLIESVNAELIYVGIYEFTA